MSVDKIEDSKTAYCFSQLIQKKRQDYFQAKNIEDKEKIMENFICDQDISNDFLLSLFNHYNIKENDSEVIFETIHSYYTILVYSLNKNQNSQYYSILKNITKKSNNLEKFEFFSNNDPIDNFKNILNIFKDLNRKNHEYLNNKENIINNIYENIQKVLNNIYDIELDSYNLPPLKEYPIYAYNFYNYQIYKIMKKFEKKRIKCLFENNKVKYKEFDNPDEKWESYEMLMHFLLDVKTLFIKFDYKNIEKDIKILKTIIFYLKLIEYSRNYLNIRENFLNIIQCLESTPITDKILEKYNLYRVNSNIPIKKEEWDSIGINEEIIIKYPYYRVAKIKHFNGRKSSISGRNWSIIGRKSSISWRKSSSNTQRKSPISWRKSSSNTQRKSPISWRKSSSNTKRKSPISRR
jgi:hypothetical protein